MDGKWNSGRGEAERKGITWRMAEGKGTMEIRRVRGGVKGGEIRNRGRKKGGRGGELEREQKGRYEGKGGRCLNEN